ncbi:MAG: dynamin family protein [Paracoccaceae bacterium]|nr:dynamin family protein [Paracoccaceae bacterium]
MIEDHLSPLDSPEPAARKPRIALMGEFSAGKSTLANLLLGHDVSPVKVTATQLPPVWYSYGAPSLHRIDNTGAEVPISSQDLGTVSHKETQAVRILLETDVLEFCDLIDMPGTSDPNMPQDVWERVLTRADGVIWCTPATQAWRQSEAALWERLPERLRASSLLLVTRMDKLQTQTDRDRVIARVQREADGLFKKVLPISLTSALSNPDDPDALESSGADLFVESLIEIVETPGTLSADPSPAVFGAIQAAAPKPAPMPAPQVAPADVVVPRRVALKRARPRTRPIKKAEVCPILTPR